MIAEFESYKGVHPGKVIERMLDKRGISQRSFALSLPEHPQTFNAILKEKRSLNIPLSLKIEKALDLEEGSLMTLQIHYDIKQERLRRQGPGPNIPPVIFWDVDMSKIDWEKRAEYVIKRVYERGNQAERNEIDRYYGVEKVNEVLSGLTRTPSGNLAIMTHLSR